MAFTTSELPRAPLRLWRLLLPGICCGPPHRYTSHIEGPFQGRDGEEDQVTVKVSAPRACAGKEVAVGDAKVSARRALTRLSLHN